MTHEQLFDRHYWNKLGFVTGLGRNEHIPQRAHLYRGTFGNVGDPMCHWGWNRDNHTSWSIFRNNVGKKGICRHCIKNALKEVAKRKKSSLQGITGLA